MERKKRRLADIKQQLVALRPGKQKVAFGPLTARTASTAQAHVSLFPLSPSLALEEQAEEVEVEVEVLVSEEEKVMS